MNPVDPVNGRPVRGACPSSGRPGAESADSRVASAFSERLARSTQGVGPGKAVDVCSSVRAEIERSFGPGIAPDEIASVVAAVARHPSAQRLLERAIAQGAFASNGTDGRA